MAVGSLWAPHVRGVSVVSNAHMYIILMGRPVFSVQRSFYKFLPIFLPLSFFSVFSLPVLIFFVFLFFSFFLSFYFFHFSFLHFNS